MNTREEIKERTAQYDRVIENLSPMEKVRVLSEAAKHMGHVLTSSADANDADDMAAAMTETFQGVPIPTMFCALCSVMATMVQQFTGGHGSRAVMLGAMSGTVGLMMDRIDDMEDAQAQARRATKQ